MLAESHRRQRSGSPGAARTSSSASSSSRTAPPATDSAFWRARDYLHSARDVRASVFLVHGLNDWNVKTKAFAAWWERLRRAAEAVAPQRRQATAGRAATSSTSPSNRWFDHGLFGVRNGILAEPRVQVQRPDDSYDTSSAWPVPGTRVAQLHLGARTPPRPAPSPRSAPQRRASASSTAGASSTPTTRCSQAPTPRTRTGSSTGSPALRRPVHLSGTPEVTLRASVDNRSAANLTAVLVDYGGEAPTMITRGWIDVQNRARARAAARRSARARTTRSASDFQPDDYIVPAGHRIGLVVVSRPTNDYTIRPLPGTPVAGPGSQRAQAAPWSAAARALGF